MILREKKLQTTSLLFLIIFLQSCFSNPDQNNQNREIKKNEVEEYWIKLYKVNSRVKFYLNGEEIFDSGLQKEETQPQKIGLTDYLQSGKNTIMAEVYNGPPYDDSLAYDKYWDIDYELFNFDEPVDYIYEKNDKGRNGLVWTHEHHITID